MKQHAIILILAVGYTFYSFSSVLAQNLSAISPSHPLSKQLQRRLTVSWQGQQLAEVLSRLSETQEINIWLDRRVNPQQIVVADFADQTLQQVLEQLAEAHTLGVSAYDQLIYIGPKHAADELATLAIQARLALKKAPSHAKRRWQEKKESTWDRLSEPKEVLASMLKQSGARLQEEGLIPHDLWNANTLPSLALIDRAVLLLVGFDLTCQISSDGTVCQIVPIQRPVVLEKKYRITKKHSQLLAKIPTLVPDANTQLQGRSLHVTARQEDQLKIKRLLEGKRTKPMQKATEPKQGSERVFSLKLKNQAVGAVINQLARQLKMQVKWDNDSLQNSNLSQQTLVSCDLKNVPLDELLRGILAPAGMTFRQVGTTIEISASP